MLVGTIYRCVSVCVRERETYLNRPIPVISDPQFNAFPTYIDPDPLFFCDNGSWGLIGSVFGWIGDGEEVEGWDG